MDVKVHELMAESVVTTQPHASVAVVREILERNHISAIPVVDTEGRLVGIVSRSSSRFHSA